MLRGTVLSMALACLGAAGCSTYSSSRLVDPDEPVASRAPEILGELEQREFGKRVQVKLPSELVVAEVRGKAARGRQDKTDKRAVQLMDALGDEKSAFSNVQPLFVDPTSFKYADVRTAAARHKADLLLVTSMSESVATEDAPLVGLLNLLVLPVFVLPTKTRDLALHVRVAVVDVRNDLVYATFEDHREERVHATPAGVTSAVEEGFDRLYAESLAKMRGKVVERLRTLQAAD